MTDQAAAVIVAGTLAVPSRAELHDRLEAARSQCSETRERSRDLWQRAESALARSHALMQAMQETIGAWQSPPAGQEPARLLEYDRMVARLQTMPVIEQAKGIVMAQSRCGAAEAFEILRRVSQQSNVPVRKLAAQIVAKAADD